MGACAAGRSRNQVGQEIVGGLIEKNIIDINSAQIEAGARRSLAALDRVEPPPSRAVEPEKIEALERQLAAKGLRRHRECGRAVIIGELGAIFDAIEAIRDSIGVDHYQVRTVQEAGISWRQDRCA